MSRGQYKHLIVTNSNTQLTACHPSSQLSTGWYVLIGLSTRIGLDVTTCMCACQTCQQMLEAQSCIVSAQTTCVRAQPILMPCMQRRIAAYCRIAYCARLLRLSISTHLNASVASAGCALLQRCKGYCVQGHSEAATRRHQGCPGSRDRTLLL